MNIKDSNIRLRFAPSPTGYLHIGTAHTTLFNWLYARHAGGAFVLRIEDTDRERSKPEYEEEIKDGLKWLGLEWDEFYRQTDRSPIYKRALEKLLAENKAYYCFCTKEELEGERQSMIVDGLPQKYSGRCRSITHGESRRRLEAGESAVIRIHVPEKIVTFHDMVRGEVKFDMSLVGDMIIAKNIDSPLYNFAVVVDDADMKISHVIRGDDHIANTPKQIVIAEALGATPPKFGHVALVLNPDRSKMSKRFLDVSLRDYIKDGYLKEALINFLALLGWHPKPEPNPIDGKPPVEKEIFSIEELIQEFDLSRVQKAGAAFNIDKLNWLNAHYIAKTPIQKLLELARDFAPKEWEISEAMIESVRSRIKKLSELKDLLGFYFKLPEYDAKILIWKDMPVEKAARNLTACREVIDGLSKTSFDKESLSLSLMEATKTEPKGEVFWPLRVALSGKEASPTPFEIIAALGKEESIRRIDAAISKLTNGI